MRQDNNFRLRVELLKEYLRQPAQQVGQGDTVARHQEAMKRIWNRALALSNGNIEQALRMSIEAVGSSRQPGENYLQSGRRLGGVPSRAFGTQKPYVGEDKPQHFFRCALEAYTVGLSTFKYDPFVGWLRPMSGLGSIHAKFAGRVYE